MITELKHGKLDVKLQICNDAYLSAISKFEDETETNFLSIFNGSGLGFATFLMYYAYFSYKVYCSRNNQPRSFTIDQFKDAFNDKEIKAADSNIEEVMRALTDSIISKETKKKQTEVVKESSSQETTLTGNTSEG